MIGFMICLIILGIVGLPWWYRWCALEEEKLRLEAHIKEIQYCYDSEQSFLDIEDDPEHLESITPCTEFHQHGPAHHPGEFVHTKIGLPTMTEEEQENIRAELAQEETEGCDADVDDTEIDTWNDDGGQT